MAEQNKPKTKDWQKIISKAEAEAAVESKAAQDKIEAEKPEGLESKEAAADKIKPELKVIAYSEYDAVVKKLNESESKVNEYWNALLRSKAEMENMRKRSDRDIADAHKYALEKFTLELLPVIDSLEHGLANSDEWMNKSAEYKDLMQNMKSGMELTLSLFINAIKKFGVEQINPLNQEFNPNLHEAMSTREDANVKPNTVVQVFQKGYTLNGRLIRPALVIVAKH